MSMIRSFTVTAAIAAVLFLFAGCGGAPPGEAQPEAPPEPAEAPAPVLMDAELAAKAGDYETALNIIRDILSGNTDDIEALRLLARVQTASGDRAGSSGTWEKIARLDPYDPDAAYETATSLAKKGDWEGVRSRMVSLDAAGNADARHFLLAGRADLELGYKTEAEKYLLRAGDLELAKSLLGKLYYQRGDLDDAERAFSDALAIDSGNYTANLHMGYIKYHRRKYRSAIKYYAAAHEAEPSDPMACLSLAAAYEKSGDRESALSYYRKGLSMRNVPASERKKVCTTVMRLLVETGRYDEAGSFAAGHVGEFESPGGIYFYWGEALLKQGRKSEARERYKKAAEDPRWKDNALKRFHSIR